MLEPIFEKTVSKYTVSFEKLKLPELGVKTKSLRQELQNIRAVKLSVKYIERFMREQFL